LSAPRMGVITLSQAQQLIGMPTTRPKRTARVRLARSVAATTSRPFQFGCNIAAKTVAMHTETRGDTDD